MAIKRPETKKTEVFAEEWVKNRSGNPTVEEKGGDVQIKRFTVLLPLELHQELKVHSAKTGQTLKDFVEAALREKLDRE